MKREQMSIVAAGVVALLAMAAHDNWISSFVGWVSKVPSTASKTPTTTGSSNSVGPATGVGANPEPNQASGPTISGNQCYDQYGRAYRC